MESKIKARNVFISFRQSDGEKYKKEICELFDQSQDVVDFSEDVDRSGLSEQTIKNYLYRKLSRSSVTIILLTNDALTYKVDKDGDIDDWIYDEVRYSLEDREMNRTNGLIAVYTPEVKNKIITSSYHKCPYCDGYMFKCLEYVKNLYRDNMLNIKPEFKHSKCDDIYDSDYDSYCSLVSLNDFKENFSKYIDIAEEKREKINQYNLTKKY